LPGSVETGLQIVASVDDVLRGVAKLGGAVRIEPLPEALEASHRLGAALLDLDVPGHTEHMDEWLASFQRWLRERRFDTVAIVFVGGERFRLRHAHRLRVWRRA
jgi:hypothetical protein